VNRALIEGMARAGLGEPFVVLRPEKAAAEAEKLRHMIERPVLTDIQVRMQGVETYDIAPEKLPDLLAERPLLLFGKWKGDKPGKIEITGRSGRGKFANSIDLRPADARKENAALRALWARKWVEVLEDELHMGGGQEVEEAITGLGLAYSLLTPFTSFVAIDSQVVNRSGKSETVRQALPLPEGVSNLAVGEAEESMASAPMGAMNAPARSMHKMAAPSPVAMSAPRTAAKKSISMDADYAAAPAKPAAEPLSSLQGIGGKGAGSARSERKDKADEKQAACAVKLVPGKANKLADIKPLLAVLRQAIEQVNCAQAKPGTTLRLRLTIDSAGKISKVERLDGDQAVAGILIGKLVGLNAGVTPQKASEGTAEVSVKF
jgi:hypothetical protein